MKTNQIILKSASEFSKSAQDELISALVKRYNFSDDSYEVQCEIDPSLQAGFTIKVNNDFYDYSLLAKLKNLAAGLYSSNKGLDEISQAALHEMLFTQQASLNSSLNLPLFTGNNDLTANSVEPHAKAFATSAFAKESSLYAKLLQARSEEDISTQLQASLYDEFAKQKQELGEVIHVADGIAQVKGLSHCLNGEMLIFASGAIGLAMNLENDSIGAVLLTMEDTVHSGMTCKGSSQVLSVPCGNAFLGQVIDPLGRPLSGDLNLQASHYRPIENPAPAIIDRKQVDQALYTGITAIDSMIPIGKGQRELIIGDRQTGKSTIALDTILNQKGKDVVCIYVAIGQKLSTLKSQVSLLKQKGAMDYTIVVSASASDSAALQYVAPYAACAMAEEFMYAQHRDVLIIYDDLTKHAQAYRAISLLLHRPPGREAYPGDVFYIHSRLLERAACLSDSLGGGSITAIPIVETQAGDISAYIPTNVISITDGQIYLESDLFFSGQRPAINVGLSVSRVGGACQVKAMRKVSGSLRIMMAQFRELQSFSQLSSEMDASSAKQIARGLHLNEILKQSEHLNRSLPESLILLTLCTNGTFDDLELTSLRKLLHGFMDYLQAEREDVLLTFSGENLPSDSDKEMLYDVFANFLAMHKDEKAHE